jgi:hypothetical protein
VGEEMEDAGRVGTDAAADEHVGQLADRGIGHHPLDVGLDQGDGGGEQAVMAPNTVIRFRVKWDSSKIGFSGQLKKHRP